MSSPAVHVARTAHSPARSGGGASAAPTTAHPAGRPPNRRAGRPFGPRAAAIGALGSAALLVGLTVGAPVASAAQPPVGLGTAAPFAVLGGSTVTNTGASVISGDVGVYPGSAIVGFPPGLVNNGTIHAADAVALQAQSDVTTAYNDAAGRTPVVTESSDLGGQTLAPGVYQEASAMGLTGTVTLNAAGDPSAVFIFQAGSTLITGSSSSVSLTGGAEACNVFWQVGSSATLGTTTSFVGTILALTSATLDTGATLQGRVFARNGAVTLDDNVITQPGCATTTSSTTTSAPGGAATTTGGTGSTGSVAGTAASATGTGAAATGTSTGTSSGTGTGTSGTTSAAVVPAGSPGTGFGGAAHRDVSVPLIIAGGVLLAGGSATALAARRRRTAALATAADPPSPGS